MSSPTADELTKRTPPVGTLLLLALIAGSVDVTTFVLLDGVFSAHITGNLVVLFAALAKGEPADPVGVVSIVLFIAVTAAVAAVISRRPQLAGRWTVGFTALQLLLLAAAGLVAITTGAAPRSAAAVAVVVLAVSAMATQNALLHLIYQRVPTTAVMTGNLVAGTIALVGLVQHGARDAAARQLWQQSWPLLAGFCAGGGGAASACTLAGSRAWVLPVVLTVIALLVALRSSRSLEQPTRPTRR